MHDTKIKEIAEGLIEDLRKYAAKAEELRRVPDESIALLKSSGLLRVLQPAACGGKQLTMRAHVDATSTVARGCNSAAWVLGVYHAHSWMMGHMPQQAQQDVYGRDQDAMIAAVIGPRGKAVRKADGSFMLNGFWPFGSGNTAATWLLLGAELFDEAGAKLDEADFLVPKADAEVLDDWVVAGLQGTGSSSIRCVNVSVPAHRSLSLSALLESNTPAYNDPHGPALYRRRPAPCWRCASRVRPSAWPGARSRSSSRWCRARRSCIPPMWRMTGRRYRSRSARPRR
jgi:3-hydroxy-9,10-secoandrosta-1,3,5(10)-triene-9,17-dione monooxygenase